MPSAREIRADIAARIARGEWKPGEKLPTTREFCEEYDCSDSTMYAVFAWLIDRNLVRGQRGGRRYVV